MDDEVSVWEYEEKQDQVENSAWPKILISLEECQEWNRSWRRDLVLKLLGCYISLRILEQRMQDLWKLDYVFEMLDMEKGFFLVRSYSKDYLHVLEGGPWIVMGYYLPVSKCKSNFRPSLKKIAKIMV